MKKISSQRIIVCKKIERKCAFFQRFCCLTKQCKTIFVPDCIDSEKVQLGRQFVLQDNKLSKTFNHAIRMFSTIKSSFPGGVISWNWIHKVFINEAINVFVYENFMNSISWNECLIGNTILLLNNKRFLLNFISIYPQH